ncbi:MAG TPA: glycosyltransferase family 39 protein [Vicinamibacteria bacterium]|nr:glycosyltransferase family 39 protein [Vicinamibacteria bacterium]
MTRRYGALLVLPLVKLVAHVAVIPGYGWFRDELYYLACADHLDWGYVDHPPLSIALLALWRAAFGDSLISIRVATALVGAATVAGAGVLAAELGAGAFGRALAMLCVVAAPAYLANNSYYSMNAWDVLLWTLAAWTLVRALKAPGLRRWAVLGAILGLGLLNKVSVLWLGAGLGVGLLSTREARRALLSPGPWAAAAIAAALFAPHVLWQAAHGWPTAEFIRNATQEKMAGISPLDFAIAQVMEMHPFTFPVWLAGLVAALALPRFAAMRPLGTIYAVVFLILVVNEKSRVGYLAPAYPMLFAAGGVALEGLLARRQERAAAIVAIAAGGAATAPLAMPALPVEAYIAYARTLGETPSTEEKKEVGALPQFFADMHGWPELVEAVAKAWAALPLEERGRAGILASNYGEAGAIDVLGRARGLPRAASGHNSYWLWGPGSAADADVILVLVPERARARLEERFARVAEVARIECGHCMPYQDHRPVYLCREPREPIAALWPGLKHYD